MSRRGGPLVDPEPILVHATPDPLLSCPMGAPALYVGDRARVATCSGVRWFHESHLATVSLRGNALHTYRFDARRRTLCLLQASVGNGFQMPENLAFSPDGRRLAVSNSQGGAVNVYEVDRDTYRVGGDPQLTIRCDGDVNPHGIAFSPCSGLLAFTTVDEPGCIRVFRIDEDASDGPSRPRATAVQELSNQEVPFKPKGIDFSPDGRFVAVCYGPNAGRGPRPPSGGLLCIHRFREGGGIDPRPVSRGAPGLGLHGPEDVQFFPDGLHLVVSNQASDTVVVVRLNPRTGRLGRRSAILRNPQARLCFPHGVGVSRDGRHLAVTSYGDDKLAIYTVRPGSLPR